MLKLPTSPSGSLCPYYFMGGELHPLKYGGYGRDKARLFAVIDAEEAFILASPGVRNRRVWVDVCQTTLDADVVARLGSHLAAIQSKVLRLCLVGCGGRDRRRLRAAMKRTVPGLAAQAGWFTDPEAAKQWLISERPHHDRCANRRSSYTRVCEHVRAAATRCRHSRWRCG